MNISCDRCDDRLSAYLDGEAGKDSAEIEAHLATCEGCRRTLAQLEACSRLLAVPAPDADPSFVARFRQRLDAIETERADRWRVLALRLMPLAATALVAALALSAMDAGDPADETFTALERTVLAAGSPPVREAVDEETAGGELLLAGAVDSRSIGGLRRADGRWP